MLVNYDVEKLNTVLHDFYNATGIYMDLLRTDFSSVSDRCHWGDNHYCKCVQSAEEGVKACRASDAALLLRCRETKQMQKHICPAGLVDVAVPIVHTDNVLGYIIFGRMRTDTDFSATKGYLQSLGLETEKMESLYNKIPLYDGEKIQSVSSISGMLVRYILLENMLRPDYDESVQNAVAYISEHLGENLSVRTISRGAGISKSVLYKRFHACFDCTVSEYIHRLRTTRAAELLKTTDISMEQISQKLGFATASYFSKIFKKQFGVSPLQYRKNNANTDK